MDIFSTQVLAKVVERLRTPPSFLLDMFFPNVQTSDKEEIFFDVTDSKPRISPFVSPLLPGKVVDGGGYQTSRSNRRMSRTNVVLMPTYLISALPARQLAVLCPLLSVMNGHWQHILRINWTI